MKLTKNRIRNIIQEEIKRLSEGPRSRRDPEGYEKSYDAQWQEEQAGLYGTVPSPAILSPIEQASSTPGFENEIVNTLNLITSDIARLIEGLYATDSQTAIDLETQVDRLRNLQDNIQKHFKDFGALGRIFDIDGDGKLTIS